MGDAYESLTREHDLIERVVDSLEACGQHLDDDRSIASLRSFCEFFANYADVIHHAKEEVILFPALVAAGWSRDTGPIAVYFAEHDHLRAYLTRVREALSSPWDLRAQEQVREAVRGYVRLLRRHTEKEEAVLLPLALEQLSERGAVQLDQRFAEIDATHRASGAFDAMVQLADELNSAWPPVAPHKRFNGPLPPPGDACGELCGRYNCIYSTMEDDHVSWKDHKS